VIAFVRPEWFAAWSGTRWNARGENYEALKKDISEHLLALLYKHLPQLAGKVVYHELSTPLSAGHFNRWPGGSLFGLALDAPNLLDPGLVIRPGTKIGGLYLSGQDALCGGFIGAVGGGMLAAHKALGPQGRARLWGSIIGRTIVPRRTPPKILRDLIIRTAVVLRPRHGPGEIGHGPCRGHRPCRRWRARNDASARSSSAAVKSGQSTGVK
jgi:hypothetical protein